MKDEKHSLLGNGLRQSQKACSWLIRSMKKCEGISLSKKPTEEEFDQLEVLTSRFARLSDILVQKVFRSLDKVELESAGTTIDVLNRAAKRGFLDDKTLRKIRELRNAIAHEYTEEELLVTFKEVKKSAPLLIQIQENLEKYIEKKFGKL